MQVRDHLSQHDAIDDLPLVTRSGTTTTVEAMDRDRRPEVRERVADWLAERDLDGELALPDSIADWEGLVDDLRDRGYGGLARRVATLMERGTRPKPMLTRARFRTDEDFDYLAGQYVGLRYDGSSRAYSLANPPSEDELEICVRRVPSGRLSPQICEDLAVGDQVTIRGPHGDLVLQDRSARDMVFLATGTGVAPLKAMIEHVFESEFYVHDGVERDVWLFLGAAWEDDAPYLERFQELADAEERFHFVPCLSREAYLSDWDGETAYVQHALLKHVDAEAVHTPMGREFESRLRRDPVEQRASTLEPDNMEVYACGINAMVHSLVQAVRRLGIPEDHIESEGFG